MRNTKQPQAKGMKLSKETLGLLEEFLERAVTRAFNAGMTKEQLDVIDYEDHIKSRLKAYPDIIERIEDLKKDYNDLNREYLVSNGESSKSKDIAMMNSKGGIRLSQEEIFEARKFAIEKKILIDQQEIDEINRALKKIKDDEYYMIIEYKYFEHMTDENIAELMGVDTTTVWRNVGKLARKMIYYLYGAKALKHRKKAKHKR